MPVVSVLQTLFSSLSFTQDSGWHLEKGIFPPSALSAYKDFRGIRNKIAHEYTFKVDTDTILSLISLGTQLLKVLSTEKPDGKEMPPS